MRAMIERSITSPLLKHLTAESISAKLHWGYGETSVKFAALLWTAAILAGLSSCEKAPPKPADTLKIVSANNQTFLVDDATKNIYFFRDGEFVQVPTIPLSDFVGKKANKAFFKQVPNFSVVIYLKYRSGQTNYQIIFMPALDGKKPKIENWLDYLKSSSNSASIILQDHDGFNVQTIPLNFGGYNLSPRTTIVDDSGTPTSVEFDGTLSASASTFGFISDATVTYVLEPPASTAIPALTTP